MLKKDKNVLTILQQETLEYINTFINKKNRAPSISELASILGLKSPIQVISRKSYFPIGGIFFSVAIII